MKAFKFNKSFLRSDITLIFIFALIKLLIHLYTNIFASYGIFRDEFYYLACASRPDIGYVDQPPLSILFLTTGRFLIGDSQFAIRLWPAIFGALTVLITGMMVKQLKGGALAITIACLAVISAPIYLGMNTFYSMNAIDIFLWALAFYIIIILVKDPQPKYWIWIVVVLGLGLLNKIGFLWLGAGLFIGLLMTENIKLLLTKWPWISALTAFVIFLPFIIWNATHDCAHIEFLHNAQTYKYSGRTRADFVSGIFLIMNTATV